VSSHRICRTRYCRHSVVVPPLITRMSAIADASEPLRRRLPMAGLHNASASLRAQYRDPTTAPTRKLSVDLIKTYKQINEVSTVWPTLTRVFVLTDHSSSVLLPRTRHSHLRKTAVPREPMAPSRQIQLSARLWAIPGGFYAILTCQQLA